MDAIFLVSGLVVLREEKIRLFFLIRCERGIERNLFHKSSEFWHCLGAIDLNNKESFQFTLLLRLTESREWDFNKRFGRALGDK